MREEGQDKDNDPQTTDIQFSKNLRDSFVAREELERALAQQ
jgi:hypothetical protein